LPPLWRPELSSTLLTVELSSTLFFVESSVLFFVESSTLLDVESPVTTATPIAGKLAGVLTTETLTLDLVDAVVATGEVTTAGAIVGFGLDVEIAA
jgi:hypothetical protein